MSCRTVDDLADVPIWRYDPEPECEHGATVTGHWRPGARP